MRGWARPLLLHIASGADFGHCSELAPGGRSRCTERATRLAKPSEVGAARDVLCSALWGWRRGGLTPPGAALRSGGTSCKVQSTGLWGVHQIQVTSPSGRPPRVALRVQMAYSPGRLRAKCEWTEPVPGTLAPAEWALGGLATLAVIVAPNDGALA